MGARALLKGVLLAGLGIVGYEIMTGRLNGTVTPPAGSGTPPDTSAFNMGDYLAKLGTIESSGRPYVKASTSSASGLYQFTQATWERLGGAWGNDPTKAFGGLTPSVQEQQMRAQMLTEQNANFLNQFGIAISNATLYAAHFLGPQTAVQALAAPASVAISSVVGTGAVKANPFLKGMTVAGFMDWLQGKAG